MSRPRLLDLFSGAGGAAMGYHRAGFEVVGVDRKAQPRYPFEHVQGDALEYLQAHGHEFDAVHASPPCQRYSKATHIHGHERRTDHPDLVAPTREALQALGRPYVIENVPGAPLEQPLVLCGTMFGLGTATHTLRRHRLFEANLWLWPPGPCAHDRGRRSIYVFGHAGGRSQRDGWASGGVAEWREAMGIGWMTANELAEAIPPAFTEWLGAQLLQAVDNPVATPTPA